MKNGMGKKSKKCLCSSLCESMTKTFYSGKKKNVLSKTMQKRLVFSVERRPRGWKVAGQDGHLQGGLRAQAGARPGYGPGKERLGWVHIHLFRWVSGSEHGSNRQWP